MNEPDLYGVLSVPCDADEEAIMKAYRKGARDHHPDRNPGDEAAKERFALVQLALDVLTDPFKRDQYDRFGTWDRTQETEEQKEARTIHQTLMQVFGKVFYQTVAIEGESPSTCDLLDLMVQELSEVHKDLRDKILDSTRIREAFADIRKRMKRDGRRAKKAGKSYEGVTMESIIKTQESMFEKNLKAWEERFEIAKGALAFLKEHRYDVDKMRETFDSNAMFFPGMTGGLVGKPRPVQGFSNPKGAK